MPQGLSVFHFSYFSGVFIFHLSRVFHFSPFSGVFVLLCCECYGFERTFLTLRCFLSHTPSPHLTQYHEFYGSERAFFTLSRFFILHSFPTFGTTCFYQGLPRSQRFFLDGFEASQWGSKHRPGSSVCLNHAVLSIRY